MSSISRNYARQLRLGKCARLSPGQSRRSFHPTFRPQFSLAAPTTSYLDVPIPQFDPREAIRSQKLADLLQVLRRQDTSPGRVWASYIDLLNFVTARDVPLEVHQEVLRKCTLSPAQIRVEYAKRLMEGRRPRVSHFHELRFQSVIFNVREAGYTPTLDDYHFILEQFAAVGHHRGAMKVLEEVTYLGLSKKTKTYSLCLQALCHRLTLPCWHEDRPRLLVETSRICTNLLSEMWRENVPITSVNLDLAIRVVKETLDMEGLEKILKVAYGVDLSFPDRPPLEFWDKGRTKELVGDDAISYISEPQPFSTAALNTTIDILGRLGAVSKLVQTFEVLTTPLLSSASTIPSSFEDDEDDDFGYNSPAVSSFPPPHAEPNTTTYNMLLKWLAKAGHASLLRHYLLQAMILDRQEDRRLRGDCLRIPAGDILALHFSMTRNMLLSVFHEANRDKNLELMRWTLLKIQRVLRRKRADLKYYTEIREKWDSVAEQQDTIPAAPTAEDNDTAFTNDIHVDSSHSMLTGASSSLQQVPKADSSSDPSLFRTELPRMPHFEVDLDASTSPLPPPPKKFNISLHLTILQREKEQIEKLEKQVTDVLGRTVQRIKERLGRRVWGQKDVYMRIQNRRTRLSRDTWRTTVNFRENRAVPQDEGDGIHSSRRDLAPHMSPGFVAARSGLTTSFFSSNQARPTRHRI